jgi:hypothetical protein
LVAEDSFLGEREIDAELPRDVSGAICFRTAGDVAAVSATALSGGKLEFFFAIGFLLEVGIARTNSERLVGEGLDERHAETETIFAGAARGSLHRDLVGLAAAASRFREGVRGRWKVPDARAPATSTGVLRIALRPETPLCRAELCRRDHFGFLYSERSSRTEPKQSS